MKEDGVSYISSRARALMYDEQHRIVRSTAVTGGGLA